MIALETKIEDVPKIGPGYQKKLHKLGIKTIRDLLWYFPMRYEDFSDITTIDKIKNGSRACIQGRVVEIGTTRTFRKWMHITEATIEDQTGSIKVLWFNQPYIEKSLPEDSFVCLAGKVTLGKGGIYFNNPSYERMSELEATADGGVPSEGGKSHNLTHTGRIVPVYSETKGITSRWLRYIIKPLLTYFYSSVPEILPEEVLKKHKFLSVKEALWQIHFPDSLEHADAAKARFSFEHLFLLQLSILQERAKLVQKKASPSPLNAGLMKQFTQTLPFELTDSQRQCAFVILKDLEKSVPMSRLLEGDVGSGKTVVATMAALSVVKNGYQVAYMAPTEILASQHFKSIAKLLEKFDVTIGFLTGKESYLGNTQVKKKELLEKLERGEIHILIGTHALISKGVIFKNLALVIVDEQHRFGVNQRSHLVQNKTLMPHLLSMTATPIPRTLALTVYGDLDLSLIKEMPKDRKKIKTIIVDPKERKAAYAFIESEVKKGHGVFVICPKIESKAQNNLGPIDGSFVPQNYRPDLFGMTELKSVKQEYEKLSKEIFPDFRIAMLHGKIKPQEKERVMVDFKKGEIDILISTSVVEVGVDIPRATVMMIEGAERFGLAQLHQFRGRVGRSDLQSYCFLFTTEPNQLNRKRLRAMVDCNNGFELAQKDLEIRGPGQLYGAQQWGLPDIAMESILNIFLVEKTRTAAKELLEKDPNLSGYPLLQKHTESFNRKIHFE